MGEQKTKARRKPGNRCTKRNGCQQDTAKWAGPVLGSVCVINPRRAATRSTGIGIQFQRREVGILGGGGGGSSSPLRFPWRPPPPLRRRKRPRRPSTPLRPTTSGVTNQLLPASAPRPYCASSWLTEAPSVSCSCSSAMICVEEEFDLDA